MPTKTASGERVARGVGGFVTGVSLPCVDLGGGKLGGAAKEEEVSIVTSVSFIFLHDRDVSSGELPGLGIETSGELPGLGIER